MKLFSKLRKLWSSSLFSSSDDGEIGVRITILENFSIVLVAAAVLLILISAFVTLTGNAAGFDAVPGIAAAIGLLLSWYLLRRTKNIRLVTSLSVLILFMFFTYLILKGFDTTQATFWFFQFVIFSLLLTGVRQGMVWVFAMLAVLLLVVRLSDIGLIDVAYEQNTLQSLFITLIVTTALIYLYERSIEKYLKRMKRNEDEIKERNAHYSALISNLGEGVISTDNNGRIQFINQPAMAMLKIDTLDEVESIIGLSLTRAVDLLDKDDKPFPKEKRPITRVLKTANPINSSSLGELKYRRPDGSTFPVWLSVTPIVVGGKTIGAVEIFRDITHEEEINQAKTEFVSLASHQLRTPLTTISWFSQILDKSRKDLSESQQKAVGRIKEGVDSMNELVNALLDVSRLEIGSIKIEHKPVDLGKLVKSVVGGLAGQIKEKSATVKVDIKDEAKISGDAKFIKMVVENLTSNAVKYNDAGGNVEITVQSVKSDQQINGQNVPRPGAVISVVDDGLGIPSDQQDRVFTKMFRADNIRNLPVVGTGLGLHLVHLIVDKHDGMVWFQSTEGQGSKFHVYLPIDYKKPKNSKEAK